MTAMTTPVYGGRSYTVDDLDTMSDDGQRYELLDGVLLVGPAPGRRHQRVCGQLFIKLEQACPGGMEVLFAPFAVQPSTSTEVRGRPVPTARQGRQRRRVRGRPAVPGAHRARRAAEGTAPGRALSQRLPVRRRHRGSASELLVGGHGQAVGEAGEQGGQRGTAGFEVGE